MVLLHDSPCERRAPLNEHLRAHLGLFVRLVRRLDLGLFIRLVPRLALELFLRLVHQLAHGCVFDRFASSLV